MSKNNLCLEFVPEWSYDYSGDRVHESLLESSIRTSIDVNSYLSEQFKFFKELFLLGKTAVHINPLINMGANNIPSMYTMMMSTGFIVDGGSLYNPNYAPAIEDVNRQIVSLEHSGEDTSNGTYPLPATALDERMSFDESQLLKRYVKFHIDKHEKILFINMTMFVDDKQDGYIDLAPNFEITEREYRTNLIEAMFGFIRTITSINNSKGDAKYLMSRYPTLAWCYNYFLSAQ